MQAGTHADRASVASALSGEVVRGERTLLEESGAPGLVGACAALETFYYAFNTRLPDLYKQIWADHPLVQLDSPVGGIVRGKAGIAALSERMLSGPARVQAVLEEIVAYVTPELVVFAGRERGTYTREGEQDATTENLWVPLHLRLSLHRGARRLASGPSYRFTG